MHLYINNPGGLVQAYEVLEDWVEDEVTWESRSDDLGPWQVAGAAAHPSHATKVLDEFEGIEGDWVTLSIDSAVEFWAQRPDENFGVLLQAQSDDGTDIPSSEAMDATLRPMMTVVFLLPDDWEPDDEEEKPDADDDEPKDEEEPQDDTGSTMGDTASADSGEKGVDSELDSVIRIRMMACRARTATWYRRLWLRCAVEPNWPVCLVVIGRFRIDSSSVRPLEEAAVRLEWT